MAGWKKLAEMKHLGKSYTRVDGAEKVTGRAKYTYDIQLPAMLHARILRSPHPHARIKSIDATQVLAMAGVKAVLTDLKKEVQFVGDEVAAVAATTETIANQALSQFKVEYEILPFETNEDSAKKPGANAVFAGRESNLGKPQERSEGDVEKGFHEADVVIERTFRMPVQIHCTFETHGCVVKWDQDELYVWDSTQGVHDTRSGMAEELNIPENKVHVITHHMGGGFGSKFGPKSYNFIAARLAKNTNAPVKLMLDREEELLSTGHRPSSEQKLKIGAKKDGTLTAFEMESYGTAGVGNGANVPQPYVYKIPNFKTTHHDVHINAGPGAPMRAPGHPQAAFAMDSLMDELAEALNMDPLELRRKNDPNQSRQIEYTIGAEKINWQKRQPNNSMTGPVKKGIGMGSGRWGGGGVKGTTAVITIYTDGSVDAKIGTQDIGVGTRTYVSAVVAEELGLEISDVKPLIGDSDYPYAPASGGSVTAPSVSPTLKRASEKAKARLLITVAEKLNVPVDDLECRDRTVISKTAPDKSLSWKQACALLRAPISEQEAWAEGLSSSGTAGCQFAEVEVDTETGRVKVLRMVAVQDCGLVLNMLTAKNQVNGAIIGEIGYAMLEQRLLDHDSGIVVNPNMENYKIPGTLEMPEFDVTIIDESHRGVIGLGEPPAIPGIGAIANAVANACGVRIRELPITPDKILNALAKQEG